LDESSQATVYESCEFAKMTRKPIQKFRDARRAENLGEEIHSDVWGPAPVHTIHHKEYYASFTNDNSRYAHIYLMAHKDEVLEHYLANEAWWKMQKNVKIHLIK
jgi:hypothetical protein